MSDKTREVYKDTADVMATLNPFVEPPRMRVSTINRINELIEKSIPKPMKEWSYSGDSKTPLCPRCETVLVPISEYCPSCGQHIDTETYEL